MTCLHLAPWLGTQALPRTIQYTLSGMDRSNATLSQTVREKVASNNVIFPYMSTVRGVLRTNQQIHGTQQLHAECYTAFGMWWHMVTHRRGSEGETGEWSG